VHVVNVQCLVTTNPHVLSERQRMDPIVPLLWLCKSSTRASDLQHFEALLALTNLASTGDQARNSIAGNKGVATMQYLQVITRELQAQASTHGGLQPLPLSCIQSALSDGPRAW
jgi:hypothetical protein